MSCGNFHGLPIPSKQIIIRKNSSQNEERLIDSPQSPKKLQLTKKVSGIFHNSKYEALPPHPQNL